MGLFASLITLPLAPVRGTAWVAQQVAEEARKFFSERVYQTMIPRNVRLSEAPSFGKPIVLYDPQSTGADSYRQLAQEVIDHA